ncbi:MAG: metal-dependent hydrolase [Candidatus Acidiferrales bacterium]
MRRPHLGIETNFEVLTVDIITHGLASLAVARGFFPRASKAAMACAVLAGTIASIDWFSSYFGPSAYLAWHGTYTHSILAAIFISAVFPVIFFARILRRALSINEGVPKGNAVSFDVRSLRVLILGTFVLPLSAGLLHIAIDACQFDGVALFWPFSLRRFAADWLPSLDPWILTILIAAIALPELLRLVGSEIGAKTKKPRGQTGAIVGLVLVFAYVGVRGALHSNVMALLISRTFHGETPHRVWAYPESLSLLTWHGVVETESALDEIDVNVAAPGDFDPDSSLRVFKPEPSPALETARSTSVARRFLATAQIPKASVKQTEVGYAVVLRDLRYTAADETKHEVAAYIELDRNTRVTTQQLVWARDLRQ